MWWEPLINLNERVHFNTNISMVVHTYLLFWWRVLCVCALCGAMCQSMFTHFYFFPHWHFILPTPRHDTPHHTKQSPHPPLSFNIIPSCNSFIHSTSQSTVRPAARPPARTHTPPSGVAVFQWSFNAYKCFNIFKIIPSRMGDGFAF